MPTQWQAGGSYVMNQTTFGLLMSTSDATGRPLLTSGFQGQPSMTLFGSPIVIASQFPDLAPGPVPIGFGDWRAACTIVNRSGPTVVVDSVTSYCSIFRFGQRVGGAPTCSNAARLLRIH